MPHYLKNDRLRVLMGNPMEFYGACRFDHAGNILQVTLNDRYKFCTTEKPDFSSKLGFGLLNEFDIEEPQGFRETLVGERFHKIGVGNLLKLEDKPYDFFHPYPMEPIEITVRKQGAQSIRYKTIGTSSHTSTVVYGKSISINQNELLIEYSLENRGAKTLKTSEYCHNFLSINKAPLGKDYELEFNFVLDPEGFEQVSNIADYLKFNRNSIGFERTPEGDLFVRRVNGSQTGKFWQLTNRVQGFGVREEVSFEASLVNLWGNAHVISPELFNELTIEPGAKARWWRKYTFFEI